MDNLWLVLLVPTLSGVMLVLSIFAYMRSENIRKENERKERIVLENSEWYKDVLELNRETKYYENVGNNGHGVYYLEAKSKANFDKTSTEESLIELLTYYREDVERLLEMAYRNSVINEVYERKFGKLKSSATESLCEKFDIPYEDFLRIERNLIQNSKLKIIHRYSVTCYVWYTSPQGRNHYSKHECYDEDQIKSAMLEVDNLASYRQSEEYRRKQERSKVTPSLRYDVMSRDGFCCVLCGRKAGPGVELEVDHIIPISRGGATKYSNLQTLCRDCNRGKGSKM